MTVQHLSHSANVANSDEVPTSGGATRHQLETLRHTIAENGVQWTTCYALCRLLGSMSGALERRMVELEARGDIPGLNSRSINREIWQNWNWEARGEEWTNSPGWKQSIIDRIMLKYIEPRRIVVEIGPGGGRWTEKLQEIAQKLIVVDLSEKCIELCRDRFKASDNIEYFVNNGRSLDFIADRSVDFIWSFDVFVHVSKPDTRQYIAEFSRILRPGGRGIIHHPKDAGLNGAWKTGFRSRVTSEFFAQSVRDSGLKLVSQFDLWDEPDGQSASHARDTNSHDTVSVFSK